VHVEETGHEKFSLAIDDGGVPIVFCVTGRRDTFDDPILDDDRLIGKDLVAGHGDDGDVFNDVGILRE
jgi:hypothetical protein